MMNLKTVRSLGVAVTVILTAAVMVVSAMSPALAMDCGGRVQTGHGDNALALAQRCGTTVQQLRLANPAIDMNKPLNGQIVNVPPTRPPGYIPDSVKRGAPPASSVLSPIPHSHTPIIPNRTGAVGKQAAGPAATPYRVQRGDTLSAIAASHGVSLARLLDANPGIDPRRLQVGSAVVIPTAD